MDNEQERLAALRSYGILDTLPEESFDRLTRLAATICGVPIALVSLIDTDRQWFKSRVGIGARQTARSISFCQHAILQSHIFEIEDAMADARFRDNPLVQGQPEIRFYAGAPLIDPEGFALGTLCVIDQKPRVLSDEQRQALRDLSLEVMEQLKIRRERTQHAHARQRLAFIIEGTSVGTWEWNVDSGETVINARWAEIIGYGLDELQPVDRERRNRLIHPDDFPVSEDLLAQHFTGKLPYYDCEMRVRHRDGRWIWVRDQGKVFNWTGEHNPGWMYGTHEDISERKAVEQALADSRQRYASIVTALPDLIFLFDKEGTFLDCHTNGQIPLFVAPDQFLGRKISEVMPAAFAEKVMAELRRSLATDEVIQFRYETPLPDSPEVEYYEARLMRANPERVVCIIRDVTVETRQTRELVHMRQLLTRTGRVARLGAWEIKPQTGQVYFSDIARELLDMSPGAEASLEQSLLRHLEEPHRSTLQNLLCESTESGKPFETILPIQNMQGHSFWARIKGASAFENDVCVGLHGTIQDIDHLYKTERELQNVKDRLQSIFNEMTDVVWSAELPEYRTTFATPSIVQLFGYPVADWLQGREMSSRTIHPEDMGILHEIRRQLAESDFADETYRIITADGRTRWIRNRIKQLRDAEGEPARLDGYITDVTEMQKYLLNLREAQYVAERANRAKSDFLSSMSHELRTPLNSILGFSQLLEMNPDQHLDEEDLQGVGHIRKAGEHLLNLINEILDLSKIESGQIQLTREAVPLDLIIDEVSAFLRPQAEQRQVKIVAPPRTGLIAQADRVRLKQVLLNLVSNAVKYNNTGGAVWIGVEPSGSRSIRIEVRDNGPGITREKLALLFQPFQRLGAENSQIEGTGIGLVITRQLAELMGGSVQAESEPGTGSTFTLEIPLAENAFSEERTIITGAAGKAAGLHGTLLYIEDNPVNRILMQSFFAKIPGIQLLLEETGEGGVRTAREKPVDCVLLDIHLPDMSGFEVLATLRAEPHSAHLPVIAVSAAATEADVSRAHGAGFTAYLTKPIVFDELLTLVSRYCAQGKSDPPSN